MPSLVDLAFSLVLSRLVNTRPRVSKNGNLLVATSDWKSQLWCLGFAGRHLIVDPQRKTVRIGYRKFWFFRSSRRLEFDWIQDILYGYADVSPGFYAYQSDDLYTVAVQLKNGERVTLFRFFGEGDFINNSIWPDWMFWDDFLLAEYTRGDQERESLLFADLVSRLIGVPISNP